MAHISEDITESFLAETTELLDSVRKDALALKNDFENKELLSELLRNLHTIKGNSRMLGYTNIEKLSHAVEDVYKSVKDKKIKISERLVRVVYYVSDKISECISLIKKNGTDKDNIDLYISYCDKLAAGEIIDVDAFASEIQRAKQEQVLLNDDDDEAENIADVQSIRIKLNTINDIITAFDGMITREFRLKHQLDAIREVEIKSGNTELSKIRKQFSSDIEALETSIFSVQQQVFDLRMLPISIVLNPLQNTIAMEAMQLGKNVKIDIPETDIAMDKVILEQLNDILMHLIRNSLDHGIETPEERKKLKKPAQGTISIKCVQETKHIVLTVSDDGRGIQYDKVREKAKVLYPERAADISQMDNKELNSYLFMSGFSTKEKVTELSGRGVGLDVVWTNVEKIKGRISVETEQNKGTSFILRFPLSLATLQGLFVYSNSDKYLIPSQHLVDIVYRNKSEYITMQNQNYVRIGEQLIPVFALSSLFKDQKGFVSQESDTILIAEYMEQRVGIVVENVQRYVSLVVKPLPAAFKKFSILQGIVFDEHYAIVPILNVPDIITKFKTLRGYDVKKYEAKTKKPVYKILVVDDSDTTRQIECSILSGNGYAVDTAVDGIDAIDNIKKKQFDLIVTDKDMPRMDGKTLVENLRLMENYSNVPVIVVSANQEPEIQQEFIDAGASAFIAKSDFKRGNLLNTVKELLNE